MTKEAFIRKWLGNRDFTYTKENRDLMREDLDKVIEYAKAQNEVNKLDLCDVRKQSELLICSKCGWHNFKILDDGKKQCRWCNSIVAN